MKQKTSIVRTLIHDPDLVVLDEPTTGVDVTGQSVIIDLIRTIKLYSKFNINSNDNYKIELIIPNNIKYINKDTIEVLKNNGIKHIDTIKIEKKTSYNNLEETTIKNGGLYCLIVTYMSGREGF